MAWLKKLFGSESKDAKARVRVCIECGQPVERHSDWCAILRTQQELDRKRAASESAS